MSETRTVNGRMARNSQKASGARPHRLRFLTAAFLVSAILMFLFCAYNHSQTNVRLASIEAEKTQIHEALNEEYGKQLDIKTQQKYYTSDAYYAQLARSRFNLLQEGDHIYVFGQ